MVWGAIAAVYGAALAFEVQVEINENTAKALLAANNAQKQAALDGCLRSMDKQSKVKMINGGKCQSCHSREFRQHHGRRVCSYCRSEG